MSPLGPVSTEKCLWTLFFFYIYMKDAKANCNKAFKSWDTL